MVGLDWFCQKVWPLVRKRVPDATFEIAGVGLKPEASGGLPVPEAGRCRASRRLASSKISSRFTGARWGCLRRS